RLDCLDRTEGKGTVPPWEEAAPSNDDRVGVVCVPLVADVVEPTDLRAVACHDPVALGGGEQATELRLPPQALLGTPTADSLVHGEKRSPLPHSARCTTGGRSRRSGGTCQCANHAERVVPMLAPEGCHHSGRTSVGEGWEDGRHVLLVLLPRCSGSGWPACSQPPWPGCQKCRADGAPPRTRDPAPPGRAEASVGQPSATGGCCLSQPRSSRAALVVTPRTLLRWHRALVRRKRRQRGG